MQSNPVDIRIDSLVEKWNEKRGKDGIRMVRILHQADEEEMVNTFFTYLLSEECDNSDIPVIFERDFEDGTSFSKLLVQELYGQVLIWNRAELSDGTYNDPINWRPDHLTPEKDNAAGVFIRNLNAFSEYLNLPDDCFLVAILKTSFRSPKGYLQWLQEALDFGISEKVRLLISDATDHRFFDPLISSKPSQTGVLLPELNMKEMMRQISAMGDPNDPVVRYRKAFNALIEGVSEKNRKGVEQYASACLEIANRQKLLDPYWYGQVLVIYSLWCNYEIGEKNWEEAISHATIAVEEMRKAQEAIAEPYIARKFMAQALMARGAIYTVAKKWGKAHGDFSEPIDLYRQTADFILGIEASRMDGYVLLKLMRRKEAAASLVQGFHLAAGLPAMLLRSSTFPGLVELLLRTPYEHLLPNAELESFMVSLYGESWRKAVKNWKRPRRQESLTEETNYIESYLEHMPA